jgi:3-methyladenine DNA glycosylase Mpg
MDTSFRSALLALVPPADAEEAAYLPAFRRMAGLILNQTTLHIAGHPHRFTEIEFYFNGAKHLDTFTHGDSMQEEGGKWYFHRTGGEYRGGTYKGLDIAFGREGVPGGILIRGVERLDGDHALLDGPCMCVDHILSLTEKPSVSALVDSFDRSVDAPAGGESPLHVTVDATPRAATVVESPRVGLTLKRGASDPRVRFLAEHYRFLSEPSRIKKGRVNLILGLHRHGHPPAHIARLTGSTLSQIGKYVAQFEAGRALNPKDFRKDLGTDELCQVFGACQTALGAVVPLPASVTAAAEAPAAEAPATTPPATEPPATVAEPFVAQMSLLGLDEAPAGKKRRR